MNKVTDDDGDEKKERVEKERACVPCHCHWHFNSVHQHHHDQDGCFMTNYQTLRRNSQMPQNNAPLLASFSLFPLHFFLIFFPFWCPVLTPLSFWQCHAVPSLTRVFGHQFCLLACLIVDWQPDRVSKTVINGCYCLLATADAVDAVDASEHCLATDKLERQQQQQQ